MAFDTCSPVFGIAPRRFRPVFPAVIAAAAVLGCAAGEEQAARQPAVYSAAAFHNTTSYSGASFSADESRLLVSSDVSGVWGVYSMPVSGGEAAPLTDSAGPVFAQSYFPGDDRFLYSGDQGGNELNHLYVGSDGAGDVPEGAVDLTPGENVRASFAGWGSDGEAFFVRTNERTPFAMDLYRYEAPPPGTWDFARHRVFENDGTFNLGDVSDDGRWLALDRLNSNYDSDVYAYDLEAGRLVHASSHEGEVEHSSGGFTPDSSQLYYGTTEHGEFAQAWSYDLESGERELVLEADWDVFYVTFSETGRYQVSAINEDGATAVEVLDTETGAPVELPALPAGDVAGVRFSTSDRLMAFYLSSDRAPSDLYVYDLDQGGEAIRLTESLNPEIDIEDLVTTEVIRYPSFDGLEIPAILWRPHGASAESPAPAMVWVHGGPGGQTRRTYRAEIQHLVNQGYVVLGVNNRGSSGYGKTFFHMDDKKHGEVDLQDCVWARTWLESQDFVDGSRVGIIGGSYGGYMVAAALAFEPEVFDVGIDIFGVTNWIRTLESTPPWWQAQKVALLGELGDPATERERLHRISPLFHASNVVRPLLVIQGANDPRVLQVESDELVEAVRANGVPVEYVLFPDEGHGFRNRVNRIEASERYAAFLAEHLGE